LTEKNKPKVFYGYTIVMVAIGIHIVGWGVFSTFGVFFDSFLNEFGWTRATISGAASLAYLALGFNTIIVGRLSDRFGPRIVMTGCGLFLGLGYLLMSRIGAIWQLYLFYGVVVAVGSSGLDVLPLSTVARWFTKRRGIMSGILKVGSGIGILIMPLTASWLILGYGWRTSYLILGSVALAVIIVAAQFLRRDPSQKGLTAYGADKANANNSNAEEVGFTLQQAIHLRQLWLLCTMCVLIFFCINTVVIHIVTYGVTMGFPRTSAASILAVLGGVSMIGRIVMGGVGDRISSRLAITICLPIIAVALFWLQIAGELWMLYLFAVVYGFAHGGFFALLAPLVAELFGLKTHGAIFGIVFFSGTAGGSLGSVLVGHIFDITGSYQLGFLICALLAVTSFIIALWLRPTGSKALQSAGGI